MFPASSAHLQKDTVVHVQHMVLSLSMRVPVTLQTYLSFILTSGSPSSLSYLGCKQTPQNKVLFT